MPYLSPERIAAMIEGARRWRASRPFEVRFWERVNKDGPGGCWIWTGALRHGHGTVYIGEPNKLDYTHRVIFRLLGREIPAGMEVDHVCRNRACCNPDHLRFVTKGQNVIENSLSPSAKNARKTHCKRGHEFTPENTAYNKRGNRNCRACGVLRPSAIKRSQSLGKGGSV